ncbi:MAG: leucyl aminopeptidase [Actinomycetota bacterium]
MATLTLAGGDAASLPVDVIVIGAHQRAGSAVPAAGSEALDAALGGKLARTLADLGFRGEAGTCVQLPTFGALKARTMIVAGLGDAAGVNAESLRRAAGTAVRAAAGSRRIGILLAANGVPPALAVRAVAEGALLGSYDFTEFRQSSLNGRKTPVGAITILVAEPKDRVLVAAARRAQIVATEVAATRDLVNTPPGDLHPADLAAYAVTHARAAGCEVEVMDERALRKGKFGGILGVGQGSVNPPRLVRIAYRHPKATRTLAFVGKGITFDSGGLSLKPSASMEWMKSDMAGAAAVIAAVTAIARLKLRVNVTSWVPTAENMPSGTAIRPGDVLTMYGGKRVEVLNTDAEGRLVLGDALVRASEESPDLIVDAATLTGAQLVALGSRTAGIMANDDDLRSQVCEAAGVAGEQVWPMPLPAELRKSIDSEIADIVNTGDRFGGMLVAGLFLKEFVGAGIPWAHMDIAGPAFNNDDPHGYTPKGGTGAAVRTLVQLAEDQAAGSS